MATPSQRDRTLLLVLLLLSDLKLFLFMVLTMYIFIRRRRRSSSRALKKIRYSLKNKIIYQMRHIHDIVGINDDICTNNLRMPIQSFKRLCFLLENLGGLRQSRNVTVEEQVAMFLSILAHHKKNVTLQTDFKRSGYTVSVYFNRVLKCIIQLYHLFVVEPVPVPDDCRDTRWKYFKGCLGALDGTYIDVRVLRADKPRYRTRKGDIATNVLAVCDRNLNFIYVLSGWEGSAADSRVLRDAISRPNGLKVPNGQYYLVDCGYANSDGFLAPYRGVRYHLKEFGTGTLAPQNYQELFNLRHAKARNVIERAFGVLKARWAILRSHAYYPIEQQNHIIMACCLLHNFVRTTCDVDPIEATLPMDFEQDNDNFDYGVGEDFIDVVHQSQQWTNMREEMAQAMYNAWLVRRGL